MRGRSSAENHTAIYIIRCRWNNNPPFFPKCSWLKDPGVKFTHVTLHCLYALWGWNPTHERQPAKHLFQRVLRPTLTSKQNFTTQLYSPDHSLITTRTQVHKIDYRHLHLGFGMTSSGTGVQIDSGDFCSLNLPSNTAASCSMSKAHTAEPGMLQRQRRAIDKNTLNWHRMAQCQQAVRSNEAAGRRSDGKEKMR